MSMNATFVQVDSTELEQFRANPSMAEELFQESMPSSFGRAAESGRGSLPGAVQGAGAQRLADALARLDPVVRGRITSTLAKSSSISPVAGGLDQVLQMMQQRASGGPRTATIQRVTLSLDKAWHGVHYVLCGEAEPGHELLSQAVLGGVAIGEDDEGFSGYGPARYFTEELVAQFAEAMSRPEVEREASGRFNSRRMTQLKIYPNWQPFSERSDQEWVMKNFRSLRDFYSDAAQKGQAVVTCLV